MRQAASLAVLGALFLCELIAGTPAFGAAGTISANLNPAGPIAVGDTVTVTLRISNYTDTVEIDSFNFDVNYPGALFTFVAGSFGLGASSGVDQQWLSKPNQESAAQGYLLNSANSAANPGVVNIAMGDLTASTPERGTIGNSGFLVSFVLQATKAGAAVITPVARANAFVLADVNKRQAGTPAFASAQLTITNPPTIAITSPTNNQAFVAPADFPITTAVFDPNNLISLVEFYANGAVVGQSSTRPFSMNASNVPAGSYSLTAVARNPAAGVNQTSAPVNITVTGSSLDFGDAPEIYPTLLSQNGARHTIRPGMFLGARVDAEKDGQPDPSALGDDNQPAGSPSDEDGVFFLTPLVPGSIARIDVVASQQGRLDAWIDFNSSGNWGDAGDRIFSSQSLVAGTNNLSFAVPTSAKIGVTFSRFRYSSQGDLNFVGLASDGEVEDYKVTISDNRTDLTLQKTANPDPVFVGSNLTYSITVSNFGPGVATGVTISDPVPSEVSFVSATSSAGTASCSLLNTPGGPTVVCNLGSLAPGGTAQATIIVTVNQAGNISNTATVTGNEPDPNLNNNSDTVRTTAEQPKPPSCDRTNKGTDFWLTFPGNYAPDPANPPQVSLCIVGTPGTSGKVTMPGLGFSQAFLIPAVQRVSILLPVPADLSNTIDIVEFKGIHVSASAEVAVYGLDHILYTTEGFLGLPTDTLGTEYFVQGFGNVHTNVPDMNGTQFAFVATADNTTVQITPSVSTGGHPAGIPYNVRLDQGHTYQLRNTNDAPNDLTGTHIVSDQPIALFGSHQCANVPNQNVWFCDYVVEQLFPARRGGTNFVVMDLATRTGATYRFMGLQDGTTIRVNGFPIGIINRGQSGQRVLFGPVQITSDNPILLTQFSNSSDYDGVTTADPAMIIIPDTRLFLPSYIVCTPGLGFASHYINVVAPTPAAGLIALDGVPIPAGLYVPIGPSGYSGAQISVAPGAHTLTSAGLAAIPFGVVMYGFAEFDAYGFPGGMLLPDITPPTVTCLVSNITVHVGQSATAPCTGSIPDLRREIQVTDNCPLPQPLPVDQDPKPGTQVGPGDYPVRISVTDANGNVGSCVITFTVIDDSLPLIFCPQGIRTNCISAAGTKVRFDVTAHTVCGTIFPVDCSPASGSLFPPGTTLVTCTTQTASGATASCGFPVTVDCSVVTITGGPGPLTISWTSKTGTLEHATDPAGPYLPLQNASSPYQPNLPGNQHFFRVKN